ACARARRAGAPVLTSFSENALAAAVAPAAAARLLFLSIPYDAGWSARVDGARVVPVRVDAGFLGVPLPAGARRIDLSFAPPLRAAGAALSLAALALYAALLAV
ncbi:MAG: YfhO family protein, partial [Elusimicrobia bacterium]|nr:YfhO family protein [Elusimicrobiota bacterium]